MKYTVVVEELPRGGVSTENPLGELRRFHLPNFEEWETLEEVKQLIKTNEASPFYNEAIVLYIGRDIASETAPMKLLWKKGKDIGVSKVSSDGGREIYLKVWPDEYPIDFARNEATEAISLLENSTAPRVKIQVEQESDGTRFCVDVNPDALSVNSLRQIVCSRLGAVANLNQENVIFFDPRCRTGADLNDFRLAELCCRGDMSVLMCQKILLTLRIVVRKSLFTSHKFDVEIYDLDTMDDLRRAICARAADSAGVKDLDPDSIRLKIKGATLDAAYEKWFYRKQGKPLGDCWLRFFKLKNADRVEVKPGTPILGSPEAN